MVTSNDEPTIAAIKPGEIEGIKPIHNKDGIKPGLLQKEAQAVSALLQAGGAKES
jgi:hypothetical protein